jgi:methylthioribose-1-phosphate isomerase
MRVKLRCGFELFNPSLALSPEGVFCVRPMRTVEWNYEKNTLRMIDQRRLPAVFELVEYEDYRQVANAIRDMVVRGAPAIGAAAGFGLALAAQGSPATDLTALRADLKNAAEVLEAARPTAVNLAWALKRMLNLAAGFEGSAAELRQVMLEEAQRIADEDVTINQRMARNGAVLIDDGDTIIHHCNTGALATVDWGTALGVIRMAHEQGKRLHVLVDETRPRLQGSRLTAWELEQYGIPYDIISDNAAGFFLCSGQVQKVFFGGDRMAANGDVANKIGTYMLALAAHDNDVPAYSAVPISTIDFSLANGDLIPIEEREPDEVLNLQVGGQPVSPGGAHARNPAFDVTPHRLLTAIVTENGVVYPPFGVNLVKVARGEQPNS